MDNRDAMHRCFGGTLTIAAMPVMRHDQIFKTACFSRKTTTIRGDLAVIVAIEFIYSADNPCFNCWRLRSLSRCCFCCWRSCFNWSWLRFTPCFNPCIRACGSVIGGFGLMGLIKSSHIRIKYLACCTWRPHKEPVLTHCCLVAAKYLYAKQEET